MSKRNKIIVSIVGITIVLLALLGITYAYYLTRIEGNTNTNSISVTTAKLELTYGDGNGILLPYGTIEPNSDKSIKFYKTDASGNPLTNEPPVDNKTFTVTNNGNDSSYVVIIDNVRITKASDGSDTNFLSNDFRYTLTCTKSDGTKCNEVNDLTIFPIKGGILVSNDMKEDDVHTYTLTMWYIDTGLNQSDDMGKTYQARVNIADVAQMENPFKTGVAATDNASLAYNIINNAKENKNGTTFVNTPLTTPAEEVSLTEGTGEYGYQELEEMDIPISEFESVLAEREASYSNDFETACEGDEVIQSNNLINKYICLKMGSEEQIFYVRNSTSESLTLVSFALEEIKEYEKTLSVTLDDYGTSYYFRGNVSDNYVTFSEMCWRIVRIQGDGSIKLTLESQSPCSENMTSDFSIGTANWGYKSENDKNIGDYSTTTGMKNKLDTWFKSEFMENDELTSAGQKIKTEEWCLGNVNNTYAYNSPYVELGTTVAQNHTSGTRFYYETGRNLYGYGITPNATLKCNGETDTSKIGALTADEVTFAGGTTAAKNNNYYLQSIGHTWWTLSRSYFDGAYDGAFYVSSIGSLDDSIRVGHSDYVRPAVSLNTGVKITSGEGTVKNPYIINEG